MKTTAIRFGPYTLVEQGLLQRDGQPVVLAPRCLQVLQAIVALGGEASKDQLMHAIWGHADVQEANLHVQVSRLRRAMGRTAVINRPGRGYRLGWPLEREAAPVGTAAQRIVSGSHLSAIVLPFAALDRGTAHRAFAAVLTEDITVQLARVRGSRVVAYGTAQAYGADPQPQLTTIARECGVRHVLQGRVERVGAGSVGVELSMRLTDAETGHIVWADVFRVDEPDRRALRRELVARLATALQLELLHAEAARLQRLTLSELQASDLVVQARTVGGSNWSRDDYERALSLYERALSLAPDDPEALARRALMTVNIGMSWPGPTLDEQLARAHADAKRALHLDPYAVLAHVVTSQVRQQQYRLSEADAAIDEALSLNPHDVYALSWRGEVLKYMGQPALAIAPLQRAMALSPRDPHRWVLLSRLGGAHLLAGDPGEAQAPLEASLALHPHWGTAMLLIAALSNLGRHAQARAVGAAHYALATTHGQFNRVSSQPDFLRQFREHVFAALVRCGLRPDLGFADAWEARQRACGAALRDTDEARLGG
jgi:TolB-like protein